jgi:hypothetical protein
MVKKEEILSQAREESMKRLNMAESIIDKNLPGAIKSKGRCEVYVELTTQEGELLAMKYREDGGWHVTCDFIKGNQKDPEDKVKMIFR